MVFSGGKETKSNTVTRKLVGTMNKLNVLQYVASMARQFYNQHNVSINALLKDSGYCDFYDQITEQDIYLALSRCSDCTGYWMQWSEDKRTESGWYIRLNETGKYVVGYFEKNSQLKEIEFDDLTKSCASFIKHELEDIRSRL
jgi:hypothetical protein